MGPPVDGAKNETHHSLPHFHARYAEYKASFDLAGEIIVGELPQRGTGPIREVLRDSAAGIPGIREAFAARVERSGGRQQLLGSTHAWAFRRLVGARIWAMTAKERLQALVEELSEPEAERALKLVEKDPEDPVIAAFRNAPEDDEPWTDEDEAAAAEGRADIAAGRTVSLEEIKREFDLL
jgi:hypothetical protein